jgi:F0F1-type ATP synthase membrane subunit c/vacuolar-type H+-ATPase subunit K
MDAAATKMIGAGIAVLALWGVGLGLGNIISTLISGIARNPSAKDDLFRIGILGVAFTEAIALFALLIAILILYK